MGGFRPSGRSTSRQIRLWGQRLSHVGAASERAIQGPGLPEIIEAGPYLSTNHHTRTLATSSTNSTKAVTRTAMNRSFVSLCAATSFWYALSSF